MCEENDLAPRTTKTNFFSLRLPVAHIAHMRIGVKGLRKAVESADWRIGRISPICCLVTSSTSATWRSTVFHWNDVSGDGSRRMPECRKHVRRQTVRGDGGFFFSIIWFATNPPPTTDASKTGLLFTSSSDCPREFCSCWSDFRPSTPRHAGRIPKTTSIRCFS